MILRRISDCLCKIISFMQHRLFVFMYKNDCDGPGPEIQVSAVVIGSSSRPPSMPVKFCNSDFEFVGLCPNIHAVHGIFQICIVCSRQRISVTQDECDRE